MDGFLDFRSAHPRHFSGRVNFEDDPLGIKQDRKLSDARRDTWAHTSPGATTAPSLRMVLKEEGYRIRIRKSNSKNLSAKPCSQPKTPAPICVVVHSLHWMIHQ